MLGPLLAMPSGQGLESEHDSFGNKWSWLTFSIGEKLELRKNVSTIDKISLLAWQHYRADIFNLCNCYWRQEQKQTSLSLPKDVFHCLLQFATVASTLPASESKMVQPKVKEQTLVRHPCSWKWPPRHCVVVQVGAAIDQADKTAATPLLFAADNAQCRNLHDWIANSPFWAWRSLVTRTVVPIWPPLVFMQWYPSTRPIQS